MSEPVKLTLADITDAENTIADILVSEKYPARTVGDLFTAIRFFCNKHGLALQKNS